jgi:putrescine transport system substrate-binding protein
MPKWNSKEDAMTINRRKVLKLASASTLLAMPFVQRAKADEAKLNVYNWADYIGETTIEDFQKVSGVAVTYDTYSSPEEMEAKLLAGSSGYDVVLQSGLKLPDMITAKIYDKLDRSKLPGWENLNPEVLRIMASYDPGNLYGTPYMWGSVGITYNLDLIKERLPDADLASLDTIFKPENAAKLADCGISFLDSPTDVMPMILKYLGIDGDTRNIADYEKVAELFKSIRKDIKTFDNTNYLNAIPNGELCVINNWSGDYNTAKTRAKEAGIIINLAYFVPKTGSPAWADNWCITADSKNKDSAHKFLAYLLEPEVIAKCTNFTNYANGNLAASKFVEPAILANPAVYPDAETLKRLWAPKPFSPEQDRAMTRTWQAIKTG